MLNHLDQESMDALYEALLCLETKEEVRKFLRDLCTVQELKAISQRYQVAKLLSEERRYAEIVELTGASTATISRVNRSLSIDGAGGYEVVFNRLRNHEE
jgi:TrpR-related protein YerC/YecD